MPGKLSELADTVSTQRWLNIVQIKQYRVISGKLTLHKSTQQVFISTSLKREGHCAFLRGRRGALTLSRARCWQSPAPRPPWRWREWSLWGQQRNGETVDGWIQKTRCLSSLLNEAPRNPTREQRALRRRKCRVWGWQGGLYTTTRKPAAVVWGKTTFTALISWWTFSVCSSPRNKEKSLSRKSHPSSQTSLRSLVYEESPTPVRAVNKHFPSSPHPARSAWFWTKRFSLRQCQNPKEDFVPVEERHGC